MRYSNLALIPARGGSKRLPGKNIRMLNGRPLIEYTIDVGLSFAEDTYTLVSTDCEKIRDVAVRAGANVPFLRPSSLSGDDTGDRPVMIQALEWLKYNEGLEFENVIYMRPTTPFKSREMVLQALSKLKNSEFDSIRSVTVCEGVHHPYWMWSSDADCLRPFIPSVDIKKYYQSQLLPHCLRLNGVVDITRVNTVENYENIYGNSIGYLEIPDVDSMDIDTELEFEWCEFLMKRRWHRTTSGKSSE